MTKFLQAAVLTTALALATAAGAREPAALVRASEILGAQVRNEAGATLGRIDGMLLDTRPRGQHYAILARADGKRFGYPVNAFRPGADGLVLHVPERNLEISPGYEDVRDAFQPEGGRRYARAREVLGQPVHDALGAETGVMQDIVISLQTAHTEWALVNFRDGGVLPMPAHAVRLSPDGPAILNPDSQRRS